MEGLRRHRSGGSSGSSSNRRIAALRRHVVQPHEAAAGATVQDGAVLLALAEDGARVRIPASFGQATAQRSSGDTVEMGGFVVQVTNPRGAVGLHVPGEEDASQALLAATTANGEFVDVQLDTEKHPALIARFALEVARHIVGPLYKDYWATADPEVWGEPGPGKIGKAAEFFGLLPQAASGAATVVGSGPGAVLMAFFARSAGLKGTQPVITTALQTEAERQSLLQAAIDGGILPADKSSPILCVCGGGPCAYSTRASLGEMGYANVQNTTLYEFMQAVDQSKTI